MSIKLFLISINTADTYAFIMHSIIGTGNRSATIACRSSTCSLNRHALPLTGSSHDQRVCAEGLPDLPGAHQDGGRPTDVLNRTSGRFAPARRPDQIEGRTQVRPESSSPLWCVCPRYPGAGTRSGEPVGASSLNWCVCPRYPRAGTRACMPDGQGH